MKPDLATSIEDWKRWLAHERRYSRHTLSGLFARPGALPAVHERPSRQADIAGQSRRSATERLPGMAGGASGAGSQGQLDGPGAQRPPQLREASN